jgi:signal transduction histidine kinase
VGQGLSAGAGCLGERKLKEWVKGRDRRLFIRSYFVLAGGLLIVALLLDRGFSALQDRQALIQDPWLGKTFQLIEKELSTAPPAQRDAVAMQMSQRLALPVRVVEPTQIAVASPISKEVQSLVDENGNAHYLQYSTALGAAIRLGPVPQPVGKSLFRFLPALFYLSILLIVGLWLRPLFKDLRVLTEASQKFAADYREPLSTAARTTQLTRLATNLDDMSGRISHLIQSQKELAAALSHEMRTPLARIRFALAVIGNQVDASAQAQLRDVNTDVEQIDKLIANMLDYARLDHPGVETKWQNIALEPWLQHVVSVYGARDKTVRVISGNDLTEVWMEPRLMELALSNLVANAYRYAKSRVSVTVDQRAGYFRIFVEDDGEGIPESLRDRVFRAFTRLDTARNRDTGGFGLGLAIVARVAALHRGSVSVGSSETLGGAKFVLKWPQTMSFA